MYKFMNFEGGVYKSNKVIEEVEDLGGYILQKNKSAREITLLLAIPEEDLDVVKKLADDLKADLEEKMLIGTEICVVSPSISRHHLPHPVCDIAERLRRGGSFTNILSIGRGVGRNISQITKREEDMIEEYDLGVFVFGDFRDCLVNYKNDILEDIDIPTVVVGGPKLDSEELKHADFYVSGVGRKVKRMRRNEEQSKLNEITNVAGKAMAKRKEEIWEDPLYINPLELQKTIENIDFIEEAKRHSPVVLHLDGVRIKLPFDKYVEKIKEIEVNGKRIDDFSDIKESKNDANDILIEILPRSYVESQ